jgi:hypothetical protein
VTTLLAESGASITEMKIAGGWNSSSVAEEYVNDTMLMKRKIANAINIGEKQGTPVTFEADAAVAPVGNQSTTVSASNIQEFHYSNVQNSKLYSSFCYG